MIAAFLIGSVGAVWAFVEIQWLCDDRWANEIWRACLCSAQAEIEADEERWS